MTFGIQLNDDAGRYCSEHQLVFQVPRVSELFLTIYWKELRNYGDSWKKLTNESSQTRRKTKFFGERVPAAPEHALDNLIDLIINVNSHWC